ncbi:MAG: biotin/lipoyl-binding protein [Bdellovibrio sp.]|nr:biotin/lipoyl-binding protein [Bdellovibrio sp.]
MEKRKSFLRSFRENVLGTENRFLFLCWSGAVVLVLALGFVLSSMSMTMLGVADSREFQVSFDSPVEIKKIYVLAGQTVKKGDLLVELSQTDLDLQLRTLKARYDRLSAEIKLRKEISRLTQETTVLPEDADPMLADFKDTKKELEIIEKKLKNLFVFAEMDGTVGSVNFKDGEKAPSFAAVLTLVPLKPGLVNGFVNENLQASVHVGQSVDVQSASGKTIRGTVVSVGSRIVPIPPRLLRIQTLPAWGREVVVQIPTENEFLVGEKVTFHKAWELAIVSPAQANAESTQAARRVIVETVSYPRSVTDLFTPEISGMVYLPDVHLFALVSDDYPENRPVILLMNEKGKVQERMLTIDGLDKMMDIESISSEGRNLYLLSSLSANKKGHLKTHRQIFAKVEREGMSLRLDKQIDLRTILLSAMRTSEDGVLRELAARSLGTEEMDLEIEGHALDGDTLYLALKRPSLQLNESFILRINSVAKLFLNAELSPSDLKVFARVQLQIPDVDAESVVTDIILDHNNFYLASSCRKVKCSAVWRVPLQGNRAELLQSFKMKHLEALSFSPQSGDLFGVFDSKKNAQYMMLQAESR